MDWDFEMEISALPEGISLLGILPLGYWMGMNHPDTTGRELFVAVGPRDANTRVGDMKIEDGKVKFRFVLHTVTGDTFRRQLLAKYQKTATKELLWGVFFAWHQSWAFTGTSQYKTSGEALKSVTAFELAQEAYLASYFAEDWGINELTTKSFRRIYKDGRLGVDNGPWTLSFSGEESLFQIPGGCIMDAD